MLYKWYMMPIGGLYATYHLLGEPETTIEGLGQGWKGGWLGSGGMLHGEFDLRSNQGDMFT